MSGSNFNHTVITSDGAALIRRSKEENKKIVFVKAVSSQKFENLRGDLVHKSKDWFESIEGAVIAVQAVDGVFKLAVSFSQAPSKVTLKSIGILAKLAGETDAQAVVFSAASDDNSQLVVDTTSAVVAFVEDLPAALNASNVDSYGTIPQGGGGGGGGDISECVASGEYDSTNHNILLKNNIGTVLSTIDCSAFLVDGMVDDVEIENGYLVISFNTAAGKQDISIPLTDIFDPSNYYTKTECNDTFLTSSDLSDYALKSEIPTDTSDLNNDSGFITSSDLSDYALKSEIPTDTSDLNNDSGFITSSDLSDYALKSEIPTDTSDLNNDSGFITSADLSDYALKSEIPTDTSDLNNDSGFITSSDLSDYALKSEIPTDTSDLTNGAGFITSADLSGYAQTADLGGAAYKGVDTSIGGSPTNDNLPTSLAVTTWVGNQGFLTSHQSLAGCVASGEYVSADHNILLKNSSGTVLSTIDASAFIKDGMVDTVAISNGYLVITFNTDAGKQPISIALSDIFDPSNYYTKTQVDSGFMTTGTNQLALTGRKTWSSNITEDNVIKSSSMSLNPSDVANNVYPSIVLIREATDTTTQESTAQRSQIFSHGSMSVSYTSSTSDEYEPVPGGDTETYNPSKTHYSATLFASGGSAISAVSSTATSVVVEDVENPGSYTLETTEIKDISTLKPDSLKIEQTTKENGVESLVKETTTLDLNHINIQHDDANGNTVKYAEFSPSEVEIQYLPGYKEALLSAENGELVITYYSSGSTHTASLTATAGLSVDSVITAHPTNGFKHSGSGGAYVSLDADNGLKIIGATGATVREIDKMGLLMGSLRIYWSDVPVQFKENNNAYEVVTYGSSAVVSKFKKTYITQVYVSEENNTLKCSTQFDGDSSWSASTVMDELTPKDIVQNRLKLIFDSSSKLTAIRLVGSISFCTLCTFKLLVPQSGSYSMIHGMLYVEPGTVNTADYTLSTPVELADGDLMICEAEFMPCSFTSPVPEPEPEP